MFIVCSNCDFKYLVNSADLKPTGRMVECANCGHQWFQNFSEEEIHSSASSIKKDEFKNVTDTNKRMQDSNNIVKNLPSTIVTHEKPSVRNSFIVVILIILIFSGFWLSRSFGINTFVLVDFYLREFIFNLNLIISDLAKIIYNILN